MTESSRDNLRSMVFRIASVPKNRMVSGVVNRQEFFVKLSFSSSTINVNAGENPTRNKSSQSRTIPTEPRLRDRIEV